MSIYFKANVRAIRSEERCLILLPSHSSTSTLICRLDTTVPIARPRSHQPPLPYRRVCLLALSVLLSLLPRRRNGHIRAFPLRWSLPPVAQMVTAIQATGRRPHVFLAPNTTQLLTRAPVRYRKRTTRWSAHSTTHTTTALFLSRAPSRPLTS